MPDDTYTSEDRKADREAEERHGLRRFRSDAIDKALKLHGQVADPKTVVQTAQTFFDFLNGDAK